MSDSQHRKPIQKIIFGSPGTGKSYRVREMAKELGLPWDETTKSPTNTIKTVFHPEYTYADFVGKLLPQTTGSGSVIYKFYEGHFLRSLGWAYRHLLDGTNENVLLVIDELNRGNAAAIFGLVFQLLDREEDHWSTYEIHLSELEIVGLLKAMQYKASTTHDSIQVDGSNFEKFCELTEKELAFKNNAEGLRVLKNLREHKIALPRNLSILATINTSDESIYYLDSAFKRRWDWEYVDVPGSKFSGDVPEKIRSAKVVVGATQVNWSDFVMQLNEFIKSNHQAIRRIEDKQIGWWFLKPENSEIGEAAIKNKLMFYLWDSVFSKDKRPLESLLSQNGKNVKLITYANFVALAEDFVKQIMAIDFDKIPF